MHYVKEFDINGVATKQVACIELHGKPNAATEGCVGVLGIDLDSPTRDVYKCSAVNGSIYTWELLSSGFSILISNEASRGGVSLPSVEFSYDGLRIPNMYIVKIGDLIISTDAIIFQIDALYSTYCVASYRATIPKGKDGTVSFDKLTDEQKASLKGEEGVGISSINTYYCVSDSPTTPPRLDAGWLNSIPTVIEEGKYLWTRQDFILTNQTVFHSYTCTRYGKDGAPGKDGKSSYAYAKEGGYSGTEAEFAEDINPDNIKAEVNTNAENYIVSELAKKGQLKPEFANDISECTDTSKLYVLPDGYIYGYIKTEVWQEGSKNWVPLSTESGGGNIYNGGKGYKFGYRLNSSGAETALSNCFVTGFIPIKNGDVLRIKNFAKGALTNFTYTGCYIALYNSSYTKLSSTAGSTLKSIGSMNDSTKIYTVKVSDIANNANNAFVRVSTNIVDTAVEADGEKLIVTINEEISDGHYIEANGWASTGHAFVPADYEGRIISLEHMVEEQGSTIEKLERTMSGDVAIPSYWNDELRTKAEAIQVAMETAGRNKSAFLWYTDAHWQYNSKKSPALLKYLYRNTSMNKINFGGDIIGDPSSFTHDNIKSVYEWRKEVKDLPNHHSVYGNHDLNHRTTDVSKMAYAYILAPEETPDMVVGGDSFYYIDNPAEKTRYLYLSYLSDASAKTEQGTFIVNAISTVNDGWHIVVIAHRWWQYNSSSNPTDGYVMQYETEMLDMFDKYNARGTYNASTFFSSQNFANTKGKVEFCIGGHIHIDYDFTSTGGIPVIITASDTNQERSSGDTEDSGTVGTITESAVFGIIADYNTKKITVVGVGRGGSRVITY